MAGSISDPFSSPASVSVRNRDMRSQSFSSDKASVSSMVHGSATMPSSVSPEAAFINETGASQIIANSYDAIASNWYDQNGIEPGGEPVKVSPIALQLVNSFLDQLLFKFLQVAKSTTLAALRPAVCEILKPKLARDTILNANEELREYLGDADEDDYAQSGQEFEWDLELAWKRTRLRCMVYSSLGELEEEDEDLFMQKENLESQPNQNAPEVISAAVAIFLTSVIEYMGEMTLTVAGHSAYQRTTSKFEKEISDGTRNPDDRAGLITVEEADMERVAFDRTLGRLWRTWKKNTRGPSVDSPALSLSAISGDLVDADNTHQKRSTNGDGDGDGDGDDEDEEASGVIHSAVASLSLKETEMAQIELYGSEQLSEDESELAAKEFLHLNRRRPVSLGDTPTFASGLQIATIAERHPAVLMLHRRFSMPSPRPPALHRDAARPRTVSRLASVLKAEGVARRIQPSPAPGRGASDGNGSHSEADDALEQATYEKAEIVKSSRVSVASVSSRSCSDSGGAVNVRRASGDHSARIIDVPAPRSPIQSQRRSLDSTDRVRSFSGSNQIPRGNSSGPEEQRKTKQPDHAPRLNGTAAKSPLEKVRTSLTNASTISESDEEVDDEHPKAPAAINVAPSARSREPLGRVPYALQTSLGHADRRMSSPKAESSTPNSASKAALLKGSHSSGAFVEDGTVEIPRKSISFPIRHSSKGEGKSIAVIERTKPREVEEDGPVPLHSAVPPRPIHTSGSCGSTGTTRHKAWKEESSSRAESVARNFEELIQSNQTISYTLTPENMRDINVKSPIEGSVISKISRKSEELRSPSIESSVSPLTRRATQPLSPISAESEISRGPGSVPRAPAGLAFSTSRTGGPQARDARVAGESMADFAEFIKFTGPATERGSSVVRNSSVPASPMKRDGVSRRVSTASNQSNRSSNSRRRYQRDSRPDSSDFMEFVRQSPHQAVAGQHRIPRHVAPFRTTMDSDQFNGIAGGRAVDAILPEIRYSQGSNTFTENSMPSMQSFSSSSALLGKNASGATNKLISEEDMMPARKSRRARDPYAVDLSDEDDCDEITPAVPRKKEESLAEFLRNYEPPAQHEPQPAQAKAPKKGISPGIIGRFSRSGAKEAADNGGKESSATSSHVGNASVSNRAGGSKHVPLMVNMPPGYDMYGPIPGYSESPDSAPGPRAPMKKNEPRERVTSGESSDLADFLRRAGPPQGQDSSSMPAHQTEGSGFSKAFGRRKKTAST